MQKILFSIALFIVCSCSGSGSYYEKGYYETVSGIKLPDIAKEIESIDNGEFVTTTVFKIDSSILEKFVGYYQFDTVKAPFTLRLLGNSYLKNNEPDYARSKNMYFKTGTKGKTSWFYLVDMDNKKLFAEIQYPDAAGN